MKKFLSILMILALALSMGTMAFADAEAPATYDITIQDPDGHTYNVYQIFTGDYFEETLANVAFGKNYDGSEFADLKAALNAISEMKGADAAAYLQGHLNEEAPIAVLNSENGYTTNQVGGYYLIVDVTDPSTLPEGETLSAYIIQVVGDTAVDSKHDSVSVTKKVDDKNDTTGAEDEIIWHDSADHDIGDNVPFLLTATIGDSFAEFKAAGAAYEMILHDTEEAGLTFQPDTVKVYVDEVLIEAGYEVVYPAEDGCTFDVVFADLTQIAGAKNGSVIEVYYESQLNEDAILGSQGNVNEVYGEFGNFYRPEEPITTPKDTVIVFTYKVDVNKVDKDLAPLAGAEFTLEKKILVSAATEEAEAVYNWKAIDVVKTEAGDQFSFIGLDDGYYRLTETVTPAGYNTIDPIEFTVTAEHDTEWTTQDRDDVLTSLTGNVATGEIQFTPDLPEGSLSADVINQKGIELPETGGIGTTLFYILGSCLVLGAIVLLITKKRMKNAEN